MSILKGFKSLFASSLLVSILINQGLGNLCIAAGLINALGGSLCAIMSIMPGMTFRILWTSSAILSKVPIPIQLGRFLATELAANLNATKTMLGLPNALSEKWRESQLLFHSFPKEKKTLSL